MVDPKFFTFMSVDENGFNQYNHCLIFYERFTETLIREDFDELAYMENLIQKRERLLEKEKLRKELASLALGKDAHKSGDMASSDLDPNQSFDFGKKGEVRKAAVRMQRAPIKIDHH